MGTEALPPVGPAAGAATAGTDEEGFPFELLGDAAYELPEAPGPRPFEGWHRPRKQFIRKSNWTASIKDILQHRAQEEELRYLGLPGSDLLDLRYIQEEVCAPQNRPLRFLGFNTGAVAGSVEGVNLDISLHEVKLLPLVNPQSDVLPDDIRTMAQSNTRAAQETDRFGPFDVINLDLCGSIARDEPATIGSMYDAVGRLIGLQMRRTEPWLFCITTTLDRPTLNGDAAARLHAEFEQMLADCPELVPVCEALFDAAPSSLDLATCTESDYFFCMAIGLCWWLFRLAQALPNKLNVRSASAYRIQEEAQFPQMLSLVLRFKPAIVAPADPAGLANPVGNPVDACATANQVADRLGKMVDVDAALTDTPDLREQLIEETLQLLLQCRYTEEAYREWVAGYAS